MKKEYVTPKVVCETFEANEYVAACWKAYCNAPKGRAFIDKNGNGRFDSNELIFREVVEGCNELITGIKEEPVANAKWQVWRAWPTGEILDVFYWKDNRGVSHCATMSAIERDTANAS